MIVSFACNSVAEPRYRTCPFSMMYTRAMTLTPKIILLDEPTEGLMPRMVAQIREIIDVLRRDGVAILLVEQNVPLTLEVCARVYIMEKGQVRYRGSARELQANETIIQQYLGVSA